MPGYFQRVMNITAGVYLGINIFPYLDNLIVTSKGSPWEHLKIACWLIERLREGEWYIGEIEHAADEVEILGFRISNQKGTIPGPRVFNPILSAP